MTRLRILFATTCLLLCPLASAQDATSAWSPRSGDAWIDRQLGDMNIYASRYRGAFIDEVVRYHAGPRDLVVDLVEKRNWAPGDVYAACAIAQNAGRPCRALVEVWEHDHADGWQKAASKVDITLDKPTLQRLHEEIEASYQRWGRPLAGEKKK